MYAVLHRAHLVRRRFCAHIRLQPRNHLALVAVVHAIVSLRKSLGVGQPELDPGIGIGEPTGQYANDGRRDGVQMNLFANDGRVTSKAALKEAPGEQDHGLTLRLIFCLGEDAAKGGGYAKQWKEIGRATPALRDFGEFGMHAGENASVAAHGGHVFKAVGLAPPVAIIAWSHRIESVACAVAIVLIERDKVAWITKR